MHLEVQVALNFVISYLYNKLPRRRVNIFGEELEKALKDKFQGHWYPECPTKGTAFRCLKTGDPIDPVLERAARESGVLISDIIENLPSELAVWIDPYEVSYRIGEHSIIKILYKETNENQGESETTSADREVTKTFNPDAQVFRPIDLVSNSLSGLSLSPKSTSPFPSSLTSNGSNDSSGNGCNIQNNGHGSGSSSAPSPTPMANNSFKGSPSPVPTFMPRSTAPLTFTTAAFAQTKFGSTKLKTSSKRANRMSPTEFSNYIKARAIQQQSHHHNHHMPQPQQHQQAVPQQGAQTPGGLPVCQSSPNSRSLSPPGSNGLVNGHSQQQQHDQSAYYFQQPPPSAYYPSAAAHRNIFESNSHNGYYADIFTKYTHTPSYIDPTAHQFYGGNSSPVGSNISQSGNNLGPIGSAAPGAASSNGAGNSSSQQSDKSAGAVGDGLNTYGLGYPASNYQHLLVAN